MAHDVFLSYAAADKAIALEVVKGLEGHGIRCWIAPRDIPAGSEYSEQIIEAVKGSRMFVVVFSASANTSPHGYCRLGDIDAAFGLLERMLLNASDWIKSWIRFDSDLDALRKLPRYGKLRELIEKS